MNLGFKAVFILIVIVAQPKFNLKPSIGEPSFVTNGFNSVPAAARQSQSSAFGKASYRQRLTLEIADALWFAAVGEGDAEAEAVADLMIEAAKDENLFVGEELDYTDKITGKKIFCDGYGSLNVVCSRADPAYAKVSASRSRKKVVTSLGRVKPQSGERLRFIVLTQPDLFGFDSDRGYELLTRAMILLKGTPYFKANFRGGVTSDEFTTGANITHFHFHENILAYTKWLDFGDLRRIWTLCLKKSASAMRRRIKFNTKDGLANVKIKEVKAKVGNSEKEITLRDAVQECCKYVVKGSDFAKIPRKYICQIERTLRGRRLIETFGEANSRKGKGKKDNFDERQYVHNTCTIQKVSDGLAPQTVVNEKDTSEIKKTLKRESLRQHGARLIREGRRDEWKELLRRKFADRREYRKKKLAQRFQYAIFRTLSGETWRGVCVSDERFYEFQRPKNERI